MTKLLLLPLLLLISCTDTPPTDRQIAAYLKLDSDCTTVAQSVEGKGSTTFIDDERVCVVTSKSGVTATISKQYTEAIAFYLRHLKVEAL